MNKEEMADRLIDLGCQHSKRTLMSLSDKTLDNMLKVQNALVERISNEQLFEMA